MECSAVLYMLLLRLDENSSPSIKQTEPPLKTSAGLYQNPPHGLTVSTRKVI